jgi:hypothetical protein
MNVLVSTEFMDFMMNVSAQNFKLKKKSGRKLLVLDTHTLLPVSTFTMTQLIYESEQGKYLNEWIDV